MILSHALTITYLKNNDETEESAKLFTQHFSCCFTVVNSFGFELRLLIQVQIIFSLIPVFLLIYFKSRGIASFKLNNQKKKSKKLSRLVLYSIYLHKKKYFGGFLVEALKSFKGDDINLKENLYELSQISQFFFISNEMYINFLT